MKTSSTYPTTYFKYAGANDKGQHMPKTHGIVVNTQRCSVPERIIPSIHKAQKLRECVFGRLFLCGNSVLWQYILYCWKACFSLFKWRYNCEDHAFVG